MAADGFELYKLLVEEVRETRKARRDLANMFTSLNLAGVGALGFLAKGEGPFNPALAGFMAVALVLTCVIWRLSNGYYTRQLGVKYDVIYDLELKLGIDAMRREYAGLNRRGPVRWFSVERAMPVLFIIGYAVFMAYATSWADLMRTIDAAVAPLRALAGR
jgi:hypothetical protein